MFLTADSIPSYLRLILNKVFAMEVPFIVLSDMEEKLVIEKFNCKNVAVLPNCIDLNDAETFNRAKNENEPLRLGYLGRIAETKGMDFLLEACVELKDKNVPFVLEIAGKEEVKGKYLPVFEEKLSDRFSFAGVVSGKSKSDYLKRLDIFVLPSFFEGLPMSLIECMNFGVVPVTTNVGSINEIVSSIRSFSDILVDFFATLKVSLISLSNPFTFFILISILDFNLLASIGLISFSAFVARFLASIRESSSLLFVNTLFFNLDLKSSNIDDCSSYKLFS